MKNNSKRTLAPKLRFPEFRDGAGWIQTPLHAHATLINERVGVATCTPYSVTSGVGLVSQQEKYGRTIAGNSFKNYLRLRKNDFAYNKSATKAFPQGYIARYVDDAQAAVPNSIFTCFRVNEQEIDPAYLDYLFASNLHGKWLSKFLTIGARAHGSLNVKDDDLLALPVFLPSGKSSLTEQRKIAECLTSLDELISAQGRKLDVLRTHKKGLLQQFFPREGEKVPRLRFPEFRTAPKWRKRKISDLLMKVSNPIEVQAAETYSEIGVRSHGKGLFHKEPVSGGTIGDKRVFRVVEDALVVNIVFAWEQAVATTSKKEEGMIASHRFPMYLPKSAGSDVRFVKFAFLTPMGKNLLGVASPGGAGRNRTLGQAEFELLEIIVPDKEEQTKIADAIDAIDDLIAPQAEKFEALQVHRRGLLQQLFPSPEGN